MKYIKVRDGIEPAIIVINGFLSEGEQDINDWLEIIDQLYPSQKVFHLDWPSSNLQSMFGLCKKGKLKEHLTCSGQLNLAT